jgi:hypothetical protein
VARLRAPVERRGEDAGVEGGRGMYCRVKGEGRGTVAIRFWHASEQGREGRTTATMESKGACDITSATSIPAQPLPRVTNCKGC